MLEFAAPHTNLLKAWTIDSGHHTDALDLRAGENTQMGLFRKTMSLGSLGMVSYRSKSERNVRAVQQTATYSRQARNAARATVAQNALDLQLQREQLEYAQQQSGIAQAQLEEQVAQRQEQQRLRVAQRRRQIEQQKAQELRSQQQSRATQAQIETQMAAREEQELRQRSGRQPPAEPTATDVVLTGEVLPTAGTVPPPSKPAGWYPVPDDPGALLWWDGHAFHPETLHYRERPSS